MTPNANAKVGVTEGVNVTVRVAVTEGVAVVVLVAVAVVVLVAVAVLVAALVWVTVGVSVTVPVLAAVATGILTLQFTQNLGNLNLLTNSCAQALLGGSVKGSFNIRLNLGGVGVPVAEAVGVFVCPTASVQMAKISGRRREALILDHFI